ncbi:hypothetical protein PEX1_019770 [Penicillium expansum]|nr:hypothetical protein PEX1_019770 [Penicillium expansum]
MDPSNARGSGQTPYPYDTNHISELLKRKRRTRGIKSCFPCRHRKVRCDGNMPCSSCVQRHHPELCCVPSSSGNEPSASNEKGSSFPMNREDDEGRQETSTLSISGEDQSVYINENDNYTPGIDLILIRLEKMDQQISSLKEELQQTRLNSGSALHRDATGATIFLGSHSDPPVALGYRKAGSDPILNDAMLLDQLVPRTYPFTNLWKQEPGAGEICETLPDESDIIRINDTACTEYRTTRRDSLRHAKLHRGTIPAKTPVAQIAPSQNVCAICQILLERARQDNTETLTETLSFKSRMAAISKDAAPFLRDKAHCRSLQDHLERLALNIHICYTICRLCRLILESGSIEAHNPAINADSIKVECIDCAAQAVQSFLDMHRLAATNLVDSSLQGSRADVLVKRLIVVLEREEQQSVWEDTDTNLRYFGPYSRALKALRETSDGQ